MQRATYVILGILVLSLVFFAYNQYGARKTAEIGLSNQYSKSFYELSASINAVTVNLGKALVSSSASQTAESLAQVTKDSFIAQAHLTSMPLPVNMLIRTSKFLNQLGDYALSLARASAITPINDNDRKQIHTLFENAKSLGKQLEEIQQKAEVGKLTWNDLSKETKNNPTETEPFKDGFQLISDELDRVPTLTYDGPFSDNIENRTPKGLVGKEISKEEAERIAREVISKASGKKTDLKFNEEVKGTIPAYSFSSSDRMYHIDIAKTGGFVIQFFNPRDVNSSKISIEEATNKAIEFLKLQDWPPIQVTYPLVEDHTVLIAFAPIQNGALVYPDLVKVEVALDNGEILAQDSLSYIMNHRERNLPKPTFSATEAEKTISKELEALSSQLVVIPKTNTTEAFCYEIKAALKSTKEEFLVYVDALTGQEANILYVVPGNKGTVAM